MGTGANVLDLFLTMGTGANILEMFCQRVQELMF